MPTVYHISVVHGPTFTQWAPQRTGAGDMDLWWIFRLMSE